MGEDEGGGVQKEFRPPSLSSHPNSGGGVFGGFILKMLEENSHIDYARIYRLNLMGFFYAKNVRRNSSFK